MGYFLPRQKVKCRAELQYIRASVRAAVIKRLSREQWRPHRGRPDKPRQLYYIDFSIIQPALPREQC